MLNIRGKVLIISLLGFATACPTKDIKDSTPDSPSTTLAQAKLQVQPNEIDFGEKETEKTFTIKNAGEQNMKWTINKDVNWVIDFQSSGKVEGGRESQITVKIDRAKLKDGDNTGKLQVTATTDDGGQLDDGTKNVSVKAFVVPNKLPNNIRLSNNSSIAENNGANDAVGIFSTSDPNPDDVHTYTLITGGSEFEIKGDVLHSLKSFDYETKNSYAIRVQTNDGRGGIFQKDFIIRITDVVENVAPTDLALSNTSVTENAPSNTVIGTLTTTDADASDTHIYTLVAGGPEFKIGSDTLYTSKSIDYEIKNSYALKIQTDDGKGGTFQKDFTITIKDKNDGTMTYNGKTYKTVKIGSQWWLAENLNEASHTKGSSSCYNDKSGNCATYGRLYDWQAAVDIASKIPGWHLPTDLEWRALEKHLGMDDADSNREGFRNSGAVGRQLIKGIDSEFQAILGGYRPESDENFFLGLDNQDYFWTASQTSSNFAYTYLIEQGKDGVYRGRWELAYRFSVRLLKD